MYELIREEGSFGANPGTKNLARHLYTRIACGKTVIIAEKPANTLAALRKQWLKLCRKVQKEMVISAVVNQVRANELTNVVVRMQNARFTMEWPPDNYRLADIYIITLEQALRWAPEADCRTLYITCDMTKEEVHLVTAWMLGISLVVMCKLA